MTHVNWAELTKEIDDKPTWNKTLYKIEEVSKNNFKRVQTVDIAKALWRVVYKNGSHVDEIPDDKGYLKLKRKDVNIYMIGDRAADVQTGLNAGGFGILTPFNNRELRPDEKNKLRKNKDVYIAKSFTDAVEFIIKRELK